MSRKDWDDPASVWEWTCLQCAYIQQTNTNPKPCPNCNGHAFADLTTDHKIDLDLDTVPTILLPRAHDDR